MKISIITPSLNSGQYIERAIKSVLEQEYNNFEHIIVDGLSTDNTIEILKKYPHLKWVSEKDTGQSNAMNKGFGLSTGDIIVYLNADDYFLLGAFTTVIPHFKNGEMFVVGDANVVLLNRKKIRVTPKVRHEEILHHWIDWKFVEEDKVIAPFPNNPVQYFYKREVQEQFSFNESNHFTMDVEFLMDASSQFDFCKINDILGVYVLHEDAKSIVASSDAENYWTLENFSYIDKFIERWNEEKKKLFKREQQKGYTKRIINFYHQQVNVKMKHKCEQLKRKQKLIEQKNANDHKLSIKRSVWIKKQEVMIKQRDEKLLTLKKAMDEVRQYQMYKHPIKKLKAMQKLMALYSLTEQSL